VWWKPAAGEATPEKVRNSFMDNRHVTEEQQVLARLAREGVENRRETSVVVAPGGRVTAWAVKVKSHVGYNVYLVRAVTVEDAGAIPTEFGEEMEATNLAESFLSQGALSPGAYAVMCRVGEKNVFYAVP
jgi:hypothetical protein